MSLETTDCPTDAWGQRILLAPISNAFYLLTPLYCLLLVRYSPPYFRWWQVLPSFLATTYMAVVSTMYHLCDNSFSCTQVCVADWRVLHDLDFLGSYMMFPVAVAWYMNAGTTWLTLGYLIMMLIESAVFIAVCRDCTSATEYRWYAAIVAQGLLVGAVYTLYLWKQGRLCKRFRQNFNLLAGGMAVLFLTVGIVFKFITIQTPEYYWWMHSIWHIGTGIGIASAHAMYSLKPIFCIQSVASDFDPFDYV